MGKVVVSQFISLDGVVEDPGGAEGFDRDGWAFEFDRGPEGDRFKLDEALASEALLLGRVTYEGFATAWPSMEGEFADQLSGMPKYVVSTTLQDPEWNNSTVIGGDVASAVADLKQNVDGNILVDEYRLMVYPTVLGAGQRLFGETSDAAALRLVDAEPAGETLILIYEPRARDADNA